MTYNANAPLPPLCSIICCLAARYARGIMGWVCIPLASNHYKVIDEYPPIARLVLTTPAQKPDHNVGSLGQEDSVQMGKAHMSKVFWKPNPTAIIISHIMVTKVSYVPFIRF